MNILELNYKTEERFDETHEIGHLNEQKSDLTTFERLNDDTGNTDDDDAVFKRYRKAFRIWTAPTQFIILRLTCFLPRIFIEAVETRGMSSELD